MDENRQQGRILDGFDQSQLGKVEREETLTKMDVLCFFNRQRLPCNPDRTLDKLSNCEKLSSRNGKYIMKT